MESKKIEELRAVWGEKPCLHPALKKAANTSDKVCTTCGRVVYSGAKPIEIKNSFFDPIK